MASARSRPRPQAPASPTHGNSALVDLISHGILFGFLAFIFMSPIPLYLGALLVLSEREWIERALGQIGIRLDADAIGPAIIKSFPRWLIWLALLAALRGSVPDWLASWMPPAKSWPQLASVAFLFAIAEAFAARAAKIFGSWIRPGSLIETALGFAIAAALLALSVVVGAL